MANCPNCGSEDIQIKKDNDVDWGRAIVGWALLGVVGGAVGAMTGQERSANACLECGTSWKASDLYNVRQFIKKMTGKSLNLGEDSHRLYLNNFISEFGSLLSNIAELEKTAQEKISHLESSKIDNPNKTGFMYAAVAFFSVLICFPIFSALGEYVSGLGILIFVITLIALPTGGYFFAFHEFKAVEQRHNRKISVINKNLEEEKLTLEEKIKNKLQTFNSIHPL